MDDALKINQYILRKISQGDPNAFEKLFKSYHGRIYSYAYHFTKNQHEAEEILQEIFTKLWSKKEVLVDVENISQWMKTITRNHCISYLKKKALGQRKEYESSLFTANCVDDSEDLLLRSEFEEQLATAMAQLTPQQRKVFELAKLQGIKRKAICNMLDLSPATVSSHLGLSTKIVRESLKKYLPLLFVIIFLKF